MAKVVGALLTGERALEGDTIEYTVTFQDSEGNDVEVEPAGDVTGADVNLTGYVGVAAAAVEAGDTVNAAIAKLEARIVELETP